MKNTKTIEDQITHVKEQIYENWKTIDEHEAAITRYKRHISRQGDTIAELQEELKTSKKGL